MNRPEYDTCQCGDFRKHHDERGCILCRGLGNGTAGMIPPCRGFRLSRLADPVEVARQDDLSAWISHGRQQGMAAALDTFTAGDIPMEVSDASE